MQSVDGRAIGTGPRFPDCASSRGARGIYDVNTNECAR